MKTGVTAKNTEMKPKRWAVHRFRKNDLDLLPRVYCGMTPGAWGYPDTYWVGCGWLWCIWQVSWYRGERLPKEDTWNEPAN